MIRINLLGQARPKAAKQAVPLEATVQILFACVAIGLAAVILGITYYQQKRQLDETNKRIASLQGRKGQPAADQAGCGPVREREVRAPAANRRDRDAAAKSQRRAGHASDGSEHGRSNRLALADVSGSQGRRPRTPGRGGIDQRRGEFHHRTQEIGILRPGRNQERQGKRSRCRGSKRTVSR